MHVQVFIPSKVSGTHSSFGEDSSMLGLMPCWLVVYYLTHWWHPRGHKFFRLDAVFDWYIPRRNPCINF